MSSVKDKPSSTRKMTNKDFQQVITEVANKYDVTRKYLVDGERSSYPALPRQVAMYMCRTALDATFDDIAERFNRQRPTVIRNVGKIASLIQKDKSLDAVINGLFLTLKGLTVKGARGGSGRGPSGAPSKRGTTSEPLVSNASHRTERSRKGAIAA